jgi:hypothetical protein
VELLLKPAPIIAELSWFTAASLDNVGMFPFATNAAGGTDARADAGVGAGTAEDTVVISPLMAFITVE